MIAGPSQAALVWLLGGYALHSGLQSLQNIFSSDRPAVVVTPAPPAPTAPGWSVSILGAAQFGLLCLFFGIGLGVYLVHKVSGGFGGVRLAIQNSTNVDLGTSAYQHRNGESSAPRTRRGRHGVLEAGPAGPKSA